MMGGRAILIAVCSLMLSCGPETQKRSWSPQDSLNIVHENMAHRRYIDEFFRTDPSSPFLTDSIRYSDIVWFPIDPQFRVSSVLHRYDPPETVTVMGTGGETRRQLKYGYFEFSLPGAGGRLKELRLNAYTSISDGHQSDDLAVWFTDRTTGSESYEVGRYLDVGEQHPDADHEYILDFNKAYNPYCAYSALYSCAIPGKEDRLDVEVRAGEMKYHQ